METRDGGHQHLIRLNYEFAHGDHASSGHVIETGGNKPPNFATRAFGDRLAKQPDLR